MMPFIAKDSTPAQRKRGYSPKVAHAWYLKNADKKRAYGKAYYVLHREHRINYSKQRRIDNPRNWVESHRKRLYGITSDEVLAMREAQNNRCAICSMEFDDRYKKTKVHIDHCHNSKRVRGLLCGSCNVSLGHMEKPNFLAAALKYLGAS